jgi:CRP/FNR family cyclic AMP-dependent transcriptional regulator
VFCNLTSVVHTIYMQGSTHTHDALVQLFLTGTKLTFKKGEFIIRPGETPNGVFYLESGLVKAYDISKYGEENLLVIRKAKEVFPLIWALTNQERNIIYQALDDVTVWRISQRDYVRHLNEQPELLRPILEMTVEMYRIHSERIMTLEYRTVRERLISFLLGMAQRFGGTDDDGNTIILAPLKQQDIASSINSSRETTSRELVRLERLGLVKTQQFKITLLDEKTLRKIL